MLKQLKRGRDRIFFIIGVCLIASGLTVLGWYVVVGGDSQLTPPPTKNIQLSRGVVFLPTPPPPKPKVVRRINVIVTGYSSSVIETDSTPFITASGIRVREGIVANNYLPFGTLVRLPEIFGDTVFEVQDRMSWQKDNFHIDVWFPTREQALKFGTKFTVLEVVE